MTATAPSATWAATRRRAQDAVVLDGGGAHDGERCRALLLRLLRDVAAFARQQQRVGGRGQDAALWVRAVALVCDTRVEQLLQGADHATARLGTASAHEVVAEAMVQELLISLAEIRLAETEALVLEEVENVESLRQLRLTLQCEEAALRRLVRDGAGKDAQLVELQGLLRDEFLQQLAQTRAHGLADSLHNETSLQFAWETIQEQKKEIVRLRAENEQHRSSRTDAPTGNGDEPLRTIQQLQLQLSSHPKARLRLLQEQVSQLEAVMATPYGRVQTRTNTTASGATVSSSQDAGEEVLGSSLLLPSHLAVSHAAPRECMQCRHHSRSYIECQSELMQLRAQAIADEDALVRAEKAHLHMKTEHAALTSALLVAKEKQGELRSLILEITDEKLKLQRNYEAQHRDNGLLVESLRRQVQELEQCRETSSRERLDVLACQEAMEGELRRLRQSHQDLESQCASLTEKRKSLEDIIVDKDVLLTIEQARSEELEKSLAMTTDELKSTTTKLENARGRLKEKEEAIQRLRGLQVEGSKLKAAAESEARELRAKLDKADEAALDHLRTANEQTERVSELKKEVMSLESAMKSMSNELSKSKALSQSLRDEAISSRDSLRRLELFTAELEGHLNQREEQRSGHLRELDRALARSEDLESQIEGAKAEQQRVYEQCHHLELLLADARAQSSSLQAQLEESSESAITQIQSVQSEHDLALDSTREQLTALNRELSETKTTVLMWMSKYHAAANEKSVIEDEMKQLRGEADVAQSDLAELRGNYRVQAADMERILLELGNVMKDTRDLQKQKRELEEIVRRHEVKEAVLEEDLEHLSREVDDALAEKQGLEAIAREQLVEIGVLHADKSLLTRDLDSEKLSCVELQEMMVREAKAQESFLDRIKQVLTKHILAHEDTILRGVSDIVSLVDGLNTRLVASSRVLIKLNGKRRTIRDASKRSLPSSPNDFALHEDARTVEAAQVKMQRLTASHECSTTGMQTEHLDKALVEKASQTTSASVVDCQSDNVRHTLSDKIYHTSRGGEGTEYEPCNKAPRADSNRREASSINYLRFPLEETSDKRLDGFSLPRSGNAFDESELPATEGPAILATQKLYDSYHLHNIPGILREVPIMHLELAATIGMFENRLCSELDVAERRLQLLNDRVASVSRKTAIMRKNVGHVQTVTSYVQVSTVGEGKDSTRLFLPGVAPKSPLEDNPNNICDSDFGQSWVSMELTDNVVVVDGFRPLSERGFDGNTLPPALPASIVARRQASSRLTLRRSTSAVRRGGIRPTDVVVPLRDLTTKASTRVNTLKQSVAKRKPERSSLISSSVCCESPSSLIGCHSSIGRREVAGEGVARSWGRFVFKVSAKMIRHRVVSALREMRGRSKRRSRTLVRFAALVMRALSSVRSRDILQVATAKLSSMKNENKSLVTSARQQCVLLAWRGFVERAALRSKPLGFAVKMLTTDLRIYRSSTRQFKNRALARAWHVMRWKHDALLQRQITKNLLLKTLTLRQTALRQNCVRKHFGAWSLLTRRSSYLRSEQEETMRRSKAHVHAPDVPSTVQATMYECVSTLQRCVDKSATTAKQSRLPPENTRSASGNELLQFSEYVDFNLLIRLLVEGGRQIEMWKDAMDKKVSEIQVREAQLKRFQTHCAELQQIVDRFRTRQHQRVDSHHNLHANQQAEDREWWTELNHSALGVDKAAPTGLQWLTLEKERRRLNQCNIAILERVITQLRDAKESRVQLHERLEEKTRALEQSLRYYRRSCIENMLLRAFFRWRLGAVLGNSAT